MTRLARMLITSFLTQSLYRIVAALSLSRTVNQRSDFFIRSIALPRKYAFRAHRLWIRTSDWFLTTAHANCAMRRIGCIQMSDDDNIILSRVYHFIYTAIPPMGWPMRPEIGLLWTLSVAEGEALGAS